MSRKGRVDLSIGSSVGGGGGQVPLAHTTGAPACERFIFVCQMHQHQARVSLGGAQLRWAGAYLLAKQLAHTCCAFKCATWACCCYAILIIIDDVSRSRCVCARACRVMPVTN